MKKRIKYLTVFMLGVATVVLLLLFSLNNMVSDNVEEVRSRTTEDIERRNAMVVRLDTIGSVSYVMVSPETFLSDCYQEKGDTSKDGFIPNEYVAMQVGLQIAKGLYGDDVFKDMPVSIALDEKEVWHLEGHLPISIFTLGGTFYIELDKKTGEVLRTFHGK